MRWAVAAVLAVIVFLQGGCRSASEAPFTCRSGTDCGSGCIDLASDNAHCGACGNACGGGQLCSDGACALSCQAGLVDCGGRCVDPQVDPRHCGADAACAGGAACGAGQVCSGGACALSCQAGLVDCGGKCIDPQVDPLHCGADATCTSGATCGSGSVCSRGACTATCQRGLVDCGGRCIDPLTDRVHCGADAACGAGAVCASGQVCSGGACAVSCPAGQQACGGKCIDPLADPTWCGAAPDCTGATACGNSHTCYQGACYPLCGRPGEIFCAGTCADPMTSLTHCGASGTCSGAAAGQACGVGHACVAGACACPAGQIDCGGACVDPASDPRHCGASASCSGATAGAACTAPDICVAGVCGPWPGPDFDWRANHPPLAPPHFVEDGTTLAHIVFDGTAMVDATGNTRWTKVGAPTTVPSGMWTPAQHSSALYSSADRWVGDAATKTFLDARTAGDFTVCARVKPGTHPGTGANKVFFANGKPEMPGTGGWALMQMHQAYCFHYHDTAADGEWMAASIWAEGAATVPSLEWSWQCGGRDGANLRLLRESYDAGHMPMGGQAMGPVGPYQASGDLPTIGGYADGTGSHPDGGVYEILVSSRPATADNMRRLVAAASGGVRAENELPVALTGADGLAHQAAPSSLRFEAGGYIAGDQRMHLGAVVRANSTATGVCYGLEAAAADWTALAGTTLIPLATDDGAGHFSQMRWDDPAGRHCINVYDVGPTFLFACGPPPALAAGSRHTFLNCFDPADRVMRVYADGALAPYVTSDPVPLSLFPRLDVAGSSLDLRADSAGLRIHRVFACSTADPALCR